MDIRERDLHASMMGEAKAEGATHEGRATSGCEEKVEAVARRYHATVLSDKLW